MRFRFLFLLIPFFATASAQQVVPADTLAPTHADSVATIYSGRLDSLSQVRRRAEAQASSSMQRTRLNPYIYRMLAPGTLYNDAVRSSLRLRWLPGNDSAEASPLTSSRHIYQLLDCSSATLASMYVTHPELFTYTDADIQGQDKLRQEVKQPIDATEGLGKMAVPTDLGNDMAEPVAVKAHRPNFWKFWGNAELKFSQNYYSENWHKGGKNNYSVLSIMHLYSSFDNQRKFTWKNTLDFELGLQTNDDKIHKIRVNNNVLRLTSEVGYQAIKNWSYTAKVRATTQNLRNYNWESYTYSSGFLDPLNLNVSVGMTYNYKSKNGKVWGDLYLAPVSYDLTYVANDSINLRRRHGIEDGHSTKYTFGPNASWNFHWKIVKNVQWNSRMYFYTNFSLARFEWEHTIDFTINRYMNGTLNVYPRFDDSSKNYKSKKKDTYWMMQEYLSLGLKYSF